ncbi:MAG: GNAT family N-acetyltransferase, partial [Bacteroidales bacterium]|nr:GNAT family N-acetyltransferase [Bacteroidales bacterium]
LHWERLATNHRLYPFVEDLLHTAFPAHERRDDAQQREYTDHKKEFSAYALIDGNEPIGLITCWHFCGDNMSAKEQSAERTLPEFVYVEHLAVAPSKRNGGYGAEILRSLKERHKEIIVLEVELPQDEMSRRRIAFYERNGFELCRLPYRQPPYRPGDTSLPMHLMFHGTDSLASIFNTIRNTIHHHVYGVEGRS